MVIVRQIIPYTLKLGTPQFRRWLVERIPVARFQRLKETVDVFDRRSTEILRAHKVALEKAQKDGSHEDDESKNIISVLREYLVPLLGRTTPYPRTLAY